MKIRKAVLGSALAIGLFATGAIVGQNWDVRRHPNLAAADGLIDQAMGKIGEAQRLNNYDMGGHAERAKDLLGQAKREVRLAADHADGKGR
jgi:hypothetical protein